MLKKSQVFWGFYVSVGSFQMAHNVSNQIGSVLFFHGLSVKGSWLGEVTVGVVGAEAAGQSSHLNSIKQYMVNSQ